MTKNKSAGAPFANEQGTASNEASDGGKKVDPKFLENGKILNSLKADFIKNKCQQTMIPMMKCLKDSMVMVPMGLDLSEEDMKKMEAASEGDTLELTEEVKMHPDIFEAAGKRYFPMFTMESLIPEDYANRYSMMSMPSVAALNMAHRIEGLDGIVLDPFHSSVGMPFRMADILYQIEGLT